MKFNLHQLEMNKCTKFQKITINKGGLACLYMYGRPDFWGLSITRAKIILNYNEKLLTNTPNSTRPVFLDEV